MWIWLCGWCMITIHRSGENKGIQLALVQTDLSEELSGCTTFERRLTSNQLLKPNPSHLHKLSWWTGGSSMLQETQVICKLKMFKRWMSWKNSWEAEGGPIRKMYVVRTGCHEIHVGAFITLRAPACSAMFFLPLDITELFLNVDTNTRCVWKHALDVHGLRVT